MNRASGSAESNWSKCMNSSLLPLDPPSLYLPPGHMWDGLAIQTAKFQARSFPLTESLSVSVRGEDTLYSSSVWTSIAVPLTCLLLRTFQVQHCTCVLLGTDQHSIGLLLGSDQHSTCLLLRAFQVQHCTCVLLGSDQHSIGLLLGSDQHSTCLLLRAFQDQHRLAQEVPNLSLVTLTSVHCLPQCIIHYTLAK